MKNLSRHITDTLVTESATLKISNNTRFGSNRSTIATTMFGELNVETNVLPTSVRDSVRINVDIRLGHSFDKNVLDKVINKYGKYDIAAINKGFIEREELNNYDIIIPGLLKMKDDVHKEYVDKFIKDYNIFETSFLK